MSIESVLALSNSTPLGLTQLGKISEVGQQAAGTPSFASVLSSLATETSSAIRASEDVSIKGIQGQASVQEVVQSVMKAQTALQTAMAIRDKAVSAYQDLIRMPI